MASTAAAPPNVGIDDFDLPKVIINRIINKALPPDAMVQKDARTALVKAATVFISYLTATSSEVALHSNHKTTMANDIYQALDDLDLQPFTPRVREFMEGYQSHQRAKRMTYRKRITSEPNGKNDDVEGGTGGDEDGGDEEEPFQNEEDSEEQAGKKRKLALAASTF